MYKDKIHRWNALEKKIQFSGNILILGCGDATRSIVPLLLKHLDVDPSQMTIMDFTDKKFHIRRELNQGVQYIQECLNKANCQKILEDHLQKGDVFIDLSFNVDQRVRQDWCHQNSIFFLSADVEQWHKVIPRLHTPPEEVFYEKQSSLYSSRFSSLSGWPSGILDPGTPPVITPYISQDLITDMTNALGQHKSAPHVQGKVCYMMLVRHGETEWNVQGKGQGWSDVPLNEQGKRQAQELGEKLAQAPIKAIYTSALSRSTETAKWISRYHEVALNVEDPTLRFYRNEFKPWNLFQPKEVREKQMFQEIVLDSMAYFREIAQLHAGDAVVIVTHRKVIQCLLGALGETPINLPNGDFICLASDGKSFWIEHQKNVFISPS